MANSTPRLGIIGGSGLYQMDGIQNIETVHVATPYGDPSDGIICGELNEMSCALSLIHI